MRMEYIVTAFWDPESLVWVAESENIPGLVLESGSLDVLMERVKYAVPELLELNGLPSVGVSVLFKSEKSELIYA